MEGFAFRADIPALNGEVLRANPINQCAVLTNLMENENDNNR